MFIKQTLALVALLSAATLNAHAALTSYTGADGVGLVYSSVSDTTWNQDANLFKTLYDANNSLITQIASVAPSYNDPSWGLQTIEAGDFDASNGRMSWWGGKAFVKYLNRINYGGSNQWRLPTSNAIFGFNGTAGNELGQLFYSELGGSGYRAIPNTNTFYNEQVYLYWSGTEYELNPLLAWYFLTSTGTQYYFNKSGKFYVWAVSPGQVAAVPIPGAIWLLGCGMLGLAGLVGLKRRGLSEKFGSF